MTSTHQTPAGQLSFSLPPPGGDGLTEYAHIHCERAYLDYAMSVVRGRALPQVDDGLKPVQRRIMFAMHELNNRHDNPHKKSARIVGDVIGKYHPHGDASVYDAAVRMAQNFSLRYPLIDGQGNFGSRDGDSPAAQRYTEVRLTKFAEQILLAELDKGTIDFVPNYDNTMKEPGTLPARLPVLLLNGAMGIAVGMATNIPPHNLREVAAACRKIIKAGATAVTDEEIAKFVPGPDFPGGGQIISTAAEIQNAYFTGRGTIRVRARWSVEPLARGQWRIIVTELPPNTSTAQVLTEIEECLNPKIKAGKKALSPDQSRVKNAFAALLDTMRDDSDQDHPVRIIIEPTTRNVTPEELTALLFANTSLEENSSINLVSIGLDGKPKQASFGTLLREWTRFRLDTVTRRLEYRLDDVTRRLHILDGRMIAFLSIEKIIKVIREADDPKAALMAKFKLSEIQAEDILEIRLRQLARLEGIKIEQEIAKLREEGAEINHLLSNEPDFRKFVADEIDKDAKQFGDDRRTLLEAAEKITASKIETVADEPVTVILSRNGFIRLRTGHDAEESALTWKDGDGPLAIARTRTVWPVIVVDANGRAYNLRTSDLPSGKGDGTPVASLLDLAGGKIVSMICVKPGTKAFVCKSDGYGFIAPVEEMLTRQKAGKAFATVGDGASMLALLVLDESTTAIAVLASRNRMLIVPTAEIKELGGGKGVVIVGLHEGDTILDITPARDKLALVGKTRTGKPASVEIKGDEMERFRGKRANAGRLITGKFETLHAFRD
ncbi:MAG: DNA topoisomerase IV subunit A [Betaproteobacteria bacterium]|nr:DNA topoisomerase IV subunit A [Betaproteobacteria bacterium]